MSETTSIWRIPRHLPYKSLQKNDGRLPIWGQAPPPPRRNADPVANRTGVDAMQFLSHIAVINALLTAGILASTFASDRLLRLAAAVILP